MKPQVRAAWPVQRQTAGHRRRAAGTKLYCLMTEANACEQLAQCRFTWL